MKKKFPSLKESGKRLLKLFFILSVSCIFWGLLTTSFFGLSIDPQSPISKVSLISYLAGKKAEYHRASKDAVYQEWVARFPEIEQAKNGKEMLSKVVVYKEKVKSYEMLGEFSDSILLEFSLIVGIIHVILSLARYSLRNVANIGWIAFTVGGYLYFPIVLKATSIIEFLGWVPSQIAATVGIQLIYGGIGFAVIAALIQHRFKGLKEITQLVQVFADILSYLRLYALALASSIMAHTFNDLGINTGLVPGLVIILVGHLVTLVLGTQGGIIHGLRLNFIEWYHYSFEGEGRLFNPLRKLKDLY